MQVSLILRSNFFISVFRLVGVLGGVIAHLVLLLYRGGPKGIAITLWETEALRSGCPRHVARRNCVKRTAETIGLVSQRALKLGMLQELIPSPPRQQGALDHKAIRIVVPPDALHRHRRQGSADPAGRRCRQWFPRSTSRPRSAARRVCGRLLSRDDPHRPGSGSNWSDAETSASKQGHERCLERL